MADEREQHKRELEAAVLMIEETIWSHQHDVVTIVNMVQTVLDTWRCGGDGHATVAYIMTSRMSDQIKHLNRLTRLTDRDCIHKLRTDRNASGRRLCRILRDRYRLVDQRYVRVEEQVAMFLNTLAHHNKTRSVGFNFTRSERTVSRYVHEVMRAVIHLHIVLLVELTPVDDTCDDPRCKWFKGYLGALDDTYINVRVSIADTSDTGVKRGKLQQTLWQFVTGF